MSIIDLNFQVLQLSYLSGQITSSLIWCLQCQASKWKRIKQWMEVEERQSIAMWSHCDLTPLYPAQFSVLNCFSFDCYHEWVIKRLAEKLCRRMEWPGPGQCLSTVSGCWPQPPEEGGAGHEKSVRTSSRSDLMLGLGWSRVTVTCLIFISPSYLSTLSHTF